MTYFQDVAKSIVSKHVADPESVTKSDLEKIIVELLSEIEYAVKHDGQIYHP